MPKFFNTDMADLALQLTHSPRRLRVQQILGIEALLALIEPDRVYPFDLVCYRITKYRKRRQAETEHSIPGSVLVGDLVTMADYITRKANVPAADLGEAYLTHQQLADELKVSTKTIRRWRSRGLMGVRVVFEDGVNRLAFLKRTVDRFVERNKDRVAKGSSFTQLSDAERIQIVERARELLATQPLKLHAAARLIAEEAGRAVETVRYTLRRYDEANSESALFARRDSNEPSERDQAMWRCREAGDSVVSIAAAFKLSADDVGQVLRGVQVRRWLQMRWEHVYDELFDAPGADALILEVDEQPDNGKRPPRIPKDLPAYLRSLYHTPLLTPEQEQDLFRRYNYLKYKASGVIASVDPDEVDEASFESLQDLVEQVETLKQRIIKANLRLVVSVAKKHVGWSSRFFEVVSDGNVSLMRAVERFDFSRGTKFSTYATWAIVKNFARSIPEEHYQYARYVTGQDEILDSKPDHRADPPSQRDDDRQRVRELIAEGLQTLDDREREIVSSHFGLGGGSGSLTLEQIGQRFGVTKERIRQIERRALSRLKQVLTPELAETLGD